MTQKQLQSAEKNLLELIRIVARLRNPKLGCPWDLEQNHLSLIPHLLEEAHEVADAIRYKDDKQVCEELGDLLLQIVLHAQIAKEEKRFSINDIAKAINACDDGPETLHPHRSCIEQWGCGFRGASPLVLAIF